MSPDMPPRPIHHYQSLNFEPFQIRLLRILPVLVEGMIQCDLVTREFPTKAEVESPGYDHSAEEVGYSALSYEWGLETFGGWILVNDCCLSVGRNLLDFLFAAYARQRKDDVSSLLWIDAICINQEDIAEKEKQIARMDHIYQLASSVLIWLGKEDLEFKHTSTVDLYNMYLAEADSLKDRVPFLWYDVYPKELFPSMASMINIVHKSYWERMWIVQEVVLLRSGIVLLGDNAFEWHLIRALILSHLADMHTTFQDTPIMRVIYASLHRGTTLSTICNSVARLGNGQCKYLHDKVYAVLGLASPRGPSRAIRHPVPSFDIDYSTAIPHLFYSVIKSSFRTSASVTVEYERCVAKNEPWAMPAELWGIIDANATRVALRLPFSKLEADLARAPNYMSTQISIHTNQGGITSHHRDSTTIHSFTVKTYDASHQPPIVHGGLTAKSGFYQRLYPIESCSIEIRVPDDPQKEAECSVSCTAESAPGITFTDAASVLRPTQILSNHKTIFHGHQGYQKISPECVALVTFDIFVFVMSVVHNTLLVPKYDAERSGWEDIATYSRTSEEQNYIQEEKERFLHFLQRNTR